MIIEIFLSSILIILLWAVNSCWIKPRKGMKYYENQLKKMNYIAQFVPYKPFTVRFVYLQKEGTKRGDSNLYYKT